MIETNEALKAISLPSVNITEHTLYGQRLTTRGRYICTKKHCFYRKDGFCIRIECPYGRCHPVKAKETPK